VITETMGAIPAYVSAVEREAAEADLARHARSFHPTSLHNIGQRILACLDPDGRQPRDEPQPDPAAGELRLWDRRDGRLGLEGYLEPEHRAAFRSLIDQLAAPRPTTDAIADTRTAAQRNADALLEICGLARAAQDCPSTAGEPPHLTVTIDWDALRTGLGAATLDYGQLISAGLVADRLLVCPGTLLGPVGVPESPGHPTRAANSRAPPSCVNRIIGPAPSSYI